MSIELIGETVEVKEVGAAPDGPRLNRPDVAARGVAMMKEAVEHAGGTLNLGGLRLVVDE